MSKLPAVTGKQALAAFANDGFVLVRISKSSHHIMKKEGHPYLLSVPVHTGKTLKAGTLRGLIGSAGMSIERFLVLLDA